jgi:hypothetical protein
VPCSVDNINSVFKRWEDLDYLREAALETNARPINESAADALVNPDFRRRMATCAGEFKKMSAPVWEREFSDSTAAEPAPRPKLSPGSDA